MLRVPLIQMLLLASLAALAYETGLLALLVRGVFEVSGSRADTLAVSLAISVVGGAAAALGIAFAQERRERARWRGVGFVGASALMALAMELSDLVLNYIGSEEDGGLPERITNLDEFRTLEARWLKDIRAAMDPNIAVQAVQFSENAFAIISSTPRLRDDPLLVREVLQTKQYLAGWPALASRVAVLAAKDSFDTSGVAGLYLRFQTYRQLTIQLLRAVFVACPKHMDRTIGAAADAEMLERIAAIEEAAEAVMDESAEPEGGEQNKRIAGSGK